MSEMMLRKINRGLRYGVIYVVTSIRRRYSSDVESVERWVSPLLIEWLERLTGYDIEVIESPDALGTTLMARRINVGNLDKDAVVEMPIRYDSMSDLKRFVKSATDVTSADEGDKWLWPEDDNRCISSVSSDERPQYTASQQSTAREPRSPRKRSWFGWRKRKEKFCLERSLDLDYGDNVDNEANVGDAFEDVSPCDKKLENDSCMPTPVPEIADEEDEIVTIEQEREVALQAIQAKIVEYVTKYHANPSQLMQTLLEGKIVIGDKQQPSPLVVNNDLKIVLPNYNEVEVKMPAMCRSIYILFLKHHDGIALRDIVNYRADLENIYSMVMPGRSEEKAKEAIDNLLNPMNNTLNEYISKIKRCFKSCIIDKNLADQYCITGKRGETYRIALDKSLITLPRAITME